jgi:hypothetical protein
VEGGVAEHRGVVDPAGERGQLLRAVGGVLGHRLVTGVADDPDRGGVPGEPARGRGIELDGDDVAAVAQEPLDHRSSDAASAACDDVGTGRVAPRHPRHPRTGRTGHRGAL